MLTKSKQMVLTGTIVHLQCKNLFVILLAKQNMINAYGNLESEFKLSKNYGPLEPLQKGKIFTKHIQQTILHYIHQYLKHLLLESREAYNTRGIVKLNHGVKDNKMLCKKIFDKIDELEKKLKTSQTTTNESDEEDDDFPISNMDDFDSVNLKLQNKTTRKQLVGSKIIVFLLPETYFNYFKFNFYHSRGSALTLLEEKTSAISSEKFVFSA